MERRFGFGFVDVNGLLAGTSPYSASQFYNGMFRTPPSPSTWMAGLIENQQGTGNIGIFAPGSSTINFLEAIMNSIAADGLNAKLVVMVGIDIRQQANIDAVVSLVNYLNGLPTRGLIGGFGYRCEQTSVLSGGKTTPGAAAWDSAFSQVRAAVTAAGWPTIHYYPQGFGGTTAEATLNGWLRHTNFPQADPINTLDTLSSAFGPFIGITHGLDGPQLFVDANGNLQPNLGCQGSGNPDWQDQSMAKGFVPSPAPYGAIACSQAWPPIIDYVFSRDGSNPLANRQWNFWIAGQNSSGYYGSDNFLSFPGVSGKNTHQLWDSAVFRNYMAAWLAANPGVFVQNSSGGPPPPPPPPGVQSTVVTINVS